MLDPPSKHQPAFPQLRNQNTPTREDSRRQLDQRPEEVEEIYTLAAAVETFDDAIFSETIDTMIVISWNSGAERLYGYSAKEMIGKPISAIVPFNRQQELEDLKQRLKRGERIEHFETTRRRKDGGTVEVSLTISPVMGVAARMIASSTIAHDITARKHTEEQLLFHTNIAQSISDAVIVTDTHCTILSWNEAAETLYGWKKEEVLGKSVFEIISYAFPNNPPVDWEESFYTHGYWKGEVIHQCKDGSLVHLLSSVAVIKSTEGEILGAVAVNKDITERKEIEKRKDDFISMASHELKTPVTSLAAFAELLQLICQRDGDEKYLPYLSQMNTQLARLTRLINDVLDLSKIQAGKLALQKALVDFNVLVKETVATLQLTTNKHDLLVIGEVTTQVLADQDRIGQVLTNLIANAIRYSPEPGNILVRLSEEEDAVTVAVQDFGIGISREHQAKIFERYYRVGDTTENTFPGLGMGLYISYEIIQQHGGCILVDSTIDKGSTFSFSLPVR